jgi:hypothetical protein
LLRRRPSGDLEEDTRLSCRAGKLRQPLAFGFCFPIRLTFRRQSQLLLALQNRRTKIAG